MKNKISVLTVFAAFTFGLAGCTYLDRHEGISTFAGDTKAANEARMVVDPWPDQFDDDEIDSDGERAAGAVERYKKGNVTEPGSSGTGGSTEN